MRYLKFELNTILHFGLFLKMGYNKRAKLKRRENFERKNIENLK